MNGYRTRDEGSPPFFSLLDDEWKGPGPERANWVRWGAGWGR